MRLPFLVIKDYALHLITKRVIQSSIFEAISLYDEYLLYLDLCGWTDSEFNDELLSHIEKDWEPILN